MKFHLQHHSPFSKSRKSLKSLVLILLLSLVGQAWAVPAVCTMADMTDVEMKKISPCHSMSNKSADASADSMNMDCCDSGLYSGLHSSSDSGSNTEPSNQHNCSCPDSGCSASFTMAVGFSSAAHIVHEQAQHYATIHFLNRVSTSLYRPPIA